MEYYSQLRPSSIGYRLLVTDSCTYGEENASIAFWTVSFASGVGYSAALMAGSFDGRQLCPEPETFAQQTCDPISRQVTSLYALT
jgi:hypothetical protein